MAELPQIRGVMLLEDTDDFIRWRVPCFCDDAQHDWTLEIEYNKKWNDVMLYIYAEVSSTCPSYHQNWFVDKWRDWSNRLRIAFRVLVLGYVEYSSDLGFKGERQIWNLIQLLTESVAKVNDAGRKYGEPAEDVLPSEDN